MATKVARVATLPGRDGAFENDIIAHEYGHGVSSRLTGGSHNAIYNSTKNTYDYLNQPKWNNEEHKIGEIWATMLYELGFQQNKYSADISKGNTLLMQIIIDGLKLQPCNPTFLQARDAMLQAEQQLTGGKHACEIWRGFAKRGLGYKAASQDLTRRPILAYHPT
ncbi:Fungalysin metallopeptidase-domain-containing protein, partial [Syncephalis fuscata]